MLGLIENCCKNPDNSIKTFDFIVAGVPFSTKDWSNGLDPVNDLFDHFVYASILTMLFWLYLGTKYRTQV